MTDNNDRRNNLDSVLDYDAPSTGGKFLSLKNRGDNVTGTLESAEIRPVTFDGEPQFYGDNPDKPKHEILLTLTDSSDRDASDADDDGTRRVPVKEYGPARDNLADELQAKGFTEQTPDGRIRAKISKAYGHVVTVTNEGVAPREGKEKQGKKILGFRFHTGADAVINATLEPEPVRSHVKETRPAAAPKATRTAEQILTDAGLPLALLPLVGDNPAPELIAALQNQHGVK